MERIADKYWKIAIEDYVWSLNEFSEHNIKLTEKEKELIVNKLLNNDNLWSVIESTIYDYIKEIKGVK